ncbi:MAG: acetamidase/formamidase family protein [Sandaracinaceae bacterium]
MSKPLFVSEAWSQTTLDRALEPALEVDAPCEVTFETSDRTFQRLARGETLQQIGFHNANVVTGPLYVRGAEPGDALRIAVVDIALKSVWSLWVPGLGPLGRHTDRTQLREIAIDGDRAVLRDGLSVPIRPMVGVVGLAPREGASSTFRPTYPWGGNMDLRELEPGGGQLLLPVQVPGALLFVGDLHAAMGTGEPTHVALEAPGRATVRIELVKHASLSFPRLREDEQTLFMGVADSYDEAKALAMDQVFAYLTNELGLTPFDAYAYASARVSLRLGGPASSIVMAALPDLDR